MKHFRRSVCRRGSRMVSRAGLLALLMAVLLLLGMMAVACGGDEASTTSSVTALASSETTSTTLDTTTTTIASTTTEAQTTTSSVATTTTTEKVTTTTAKPTTTTKQTTTTAKPTTTTTKGPIVLTISGPSGSKELSMAELKAMSASSGYGGWKNQLGNITAPVAYKGVRLTALMELVGGGGSATIVASDGYEQTLSGGELSGQTSMYDPTTGEPISSISGSLKTILAYAKGGSAIGSGDGPLRIAFVSPEADQVTDSALWVKMVKTIRVN